MTTPPCCSTTRTPSSTAEIRATGRPFRARHRAAISDVVCRVVRDREPLPVAVGGLGLDDAPAARLGGMVRDDLSRLGEHNYARFRLRLSDMQRWAADGKPVME